MQSSQIQSINYYRSKIHSIEDMYKQYYQSIEKLHLDTEDYHSRQKEIIMLKDIIAELQKAISDAHIAIFEERQQTLTNRKTIDQLTTLQLKYQCQIHELLPLLAPNNNEAVYFIDSRPEKQRFPLKPIKQEAGLSLERQPNANYTQKIQKNVGPVTTNPKHSLRTIYFPLEQSNSMVSELEMLKSQYEELKIFYDMQISAIKEDKIVREEEMRLKFIDFDEKIAIATQRLSSIKETNYVLNKDYFNFKFNSDESKKQIAAELERLKSENEESRKELKDTIDCTNKEIKGLEVTLGTKSNDIYKNMRKEMEQKDESLMLVKYEYEKIQGSLIGQIREVEEKIVGKDREYELSKVKREAALEGFGRDMNNLKRRVRLYDEYVKSLKKLHEESKAKDLEDIKSLMEQVDNLAKVLKEIKCKSIEEMPQHLE